MSASGELTVGDEFAGYRIEALLGRGGMGVVYRAHDQRLKRSVALKLVAPNVSGDSRFRERFLVEAELASSLEHPNVVPVYDAGEIDGQLYLVMRYVDGNDLKSLLAEEGGLLAEQALGVCRQVGAALDAAHARGLVHRDVKPSNVLLDELGHAYLADFGLSRRVSDPRLSTAGDLPVGTPAYMAPEQIEGGELNARTDVYGLGCLLFECLTGRQPYEGNSDFAVLWAKLQSQPPRPSETDRRLPIEVDAVIAKAMAQNPDQRYESCLELIEDAANAFAAPGDKREPSRRVLPGGTVTLLFTDIEGSTGLLKELGRDAYECVLAEQGGIVRAAVAAHAGWVIDTQRDSLFCAFRAAGDAVSAAVEAQRELAEATWPQKANVRIRMGLHSGEPKVGEERYVGLGVHEAARVGEAAHGCQVLVSEATRALLGELPAGLALRDLGLHRLRDIDEPVRLYQVVAAGLEERFPAPRTLGKPLFKRRLVRGGLLAAGLIAAGVAAVVVLAGGSASARPVNLAANSLGVIDPKTDRPVGDVHLGFVPGDVTASGDLVWVLNAEGRTAVAIDPHTLRVVQTVGLDGTPEDQYSTGRNDYVTLFGGAIDELTTSGATRVALWKPSVVPSVAGGPSICTAYVTGAGKDVWVSQGQHLAEIDGTSGSVLRPLTLAPVPASVQTCYGVRVFDGSLFAARDPDKSIGSLNPRTGAYTPIQSDVDSFDFTTANGAQDTWAAGLGSLWYGTNELNTKSFKEQGVITGVDLQNGVVTSKTVIGGTAGPVTVDPSGVWAIALSKQTLTQINPATGATLRTLRLRHYPCCSSAAGGAGVAAGHDRIWIAVQSP
jgi:serine/threonine-protein kinase